MTLAPGSLVFVRVFPSAAAARAAFEDLAPRVMCAVNAYPFHGRPPGALLCTTIAWSNAAEPRGKITVVLEPAREFPDWPKGYVAYFAELDLGDLRIEQFENGRQITYPPSAP